MKPKLFAGCWKKKIHFFILTVLFFSKNISILNLCVVCLFMNSTLINKCLSQPKIKFKLKNMSGRKKLSHTTGLQICSGLNTSKTLLTYSKKGTLITTYKVTVCVRNN